MKLRETPTGQQSPALSEGIIRYYDRGRWLTRRWPRKRHTPKSLYVQRQNQWFKEICALLKYAPGEEWEKAIEIAFHSGLYPKDILTSAAAGNMYDIYLEDGSEIQKYVPKVEEHVFTGCRLWRTTAQSIPANTWTAIQYQQALIDTSGFFDLSNPSRITIPTGVNVIEITAGVWLPNVSTANVQARIISSGGVVYAQTANMGMNEQRWQITAPAFATGPGIWFELQINCNQARSFSAGEHTAIVCNVLDSQ
jgi:hypothetical protein